MTTTTTTDNVNAAGTVTPTLSGTFRFEIELPLDGFELLDGELPEEAVREIGDEFARSLRVYLGEHNPRACSAAYRGATLVDWQHQPSATS